MNDHDERLRMMIRPDQQTWDLSPNDVAAIRWVLADRDRLRRERNAFLVVVAIASFRHDDDDTLMAQLLDTPRKVALMAKETVKAIEGTPLYAKYLDLPSDLGATS